MARVLVIEDRPDHLEWVRAALQAEGLVVLEARDALAGLQYAVEGTPDLVLVAATLSGLDGFDVTERILAEPESRGLPVLMLVDRADAATRRAAEQAGARAIVPCGWDRAGLLGAVRERLLATGVSWLRIDRSTGAASGARLD